MRLASSWGRHSETADARSCGGARAAGTGDGLRARPSEREGEDRLARPPCTCSEENSAGHAAGGGGRSASLAAPRASQPRGRGPPRHAWPGRSRRAHIRWVVQRRHRASRPARRCRFAPGSAPSGDSRRGGCSAWSARPRHRRRNHRSVRIDPDRDGNSRGQGPLACTRACRRGRGHDRSDRLHRRRLRRGGDGRRGRRDHRRASLPGGSGAAGAGSAIRRLSRSGRASTCSAV